MLARKGKMRQSADCGATGRARLQVKRVVVTHPDGGVGFDWVSGERQRLCAFSGRTHRSSTPRARVDFWHDVLTLKCFKRTPYVCEQARELPAWTLPTSLRGHKHLFEAPMPMEQVVLEDALPEMFVFADGTRCAPAKPVMMPPLKVEEELSDMFVCADGSRLGGEAEGPPGA